MTEPVSVENNVCAPAFQKHWFCAAVCRDGQVVMCDSDSPASFMEILETSLLAWVDYRIPDFEKDVRTGAAALGFSEQLVNALADDPRLFYEDYDVEMGIKVPSIQIKMDEHIDVQSYPTLLLLRRNFILTVHPLLVDRRFTRLRRYSNTILKKIPLTLSAEDKLTMLLIHVALTDPDLAGLHFTGSSATFKTLWRTIAENLDRYRSYPRIVGETGGKDFVVVHPSADPAPLTTALVRGAFEYQGQKCSAASRAYVPRSIWQSGLRDELADVTRSLRYGDITDLTNFGGAVIDARAFDRHRRALDRAKQAPSLEILAGGGTDDSEGWFVDPTVLVGTDPADEAFTTEYFGPILAVHVYDDSEYAATLDLVDRTSPYALTGAVFATDRAAVERAHRALRHAAGNFYVNDRPTGSIVSRQPFGGSRASGTNDKAGSMLNVERWTSPRAIKETFDAPVGHTYPHQLS